VPCISIHDDIVINPIIKRQLNFNNVFFSHRLDKFPPSVVREDSNHHSLLIVAPLSFFFVCLAIGVLSI